MGRIFRIDLEGDIYVCKHCLTHIALHDDVIAKTFYCVHGKAYLFDKVSNVTVGGQEERMMMTGLHIVGDIFCVCCGSLLGWKYFVAYEKQQKFKEGKFILERCKVNRTCRSRFNTEEASQAGGTDSEDV